MADLQQVGCVEFMTIRTDAGRSRIAAATGGKVMPNDFLDDLPELIEGFEQEAKDGGAGPAEIRRAG